MSQVYGILAAAGWIWTILIAIVLLIALGRPRPRRRGPTLDDMESHEKQS